ncbi:MAG: hypothetical protein E7278_10435 [Lachnospiraceae bacterium]|nr:hypothetical protein [Lachnospiraceae bacterium]
MSKKILYDTKNVIANDTPLEYFQSSNVGRENNDEIFFWLEGNHKLFSIEGEYRIGLIYKHNKIYTVEIFRIDGYEEELDSSIDQSRYMALSNCLLQNGFSDLDIRYSFNKRNGYGALLIYL